MTTTTEPHRITVDYFESVYADAQGDATRVPWAGRGASRALVNWLNAVAPSVVRCGARVAVVGCGLGDDAREVLRRGYDVTAFDCSETAIRWASELDPKHGHAYVRADMLAPPSRWLHRFDLVIDVNNLQFLPPDQRGEAIAAQARLLAPHGHLLIICLGRETPPAAGQGPPWPLTRDELLAATSAAGLLPEGMINCFADDEDVLRIRGMFRRA